MVERRRVPMDPAYTRSAAASSIATMRVAVVLVVVVVVTFVVVVGMLRATEVVLVDIRPDVASQIGAGILIEAKMDASVAILSRARARAFCESELPSATATCLAARLNTKLGEDTA